MSSYETAYGAAGAAGALDKFLADKFAQEKFAEVQRQAKAAEASELAQRAQQAEQFRQSEGRRQTEYVGQRDENYQNRLQDVKRNDLAIIDKQKDREHQNELRRIDAEADVKNREDQQAFTAEEHRLTREHATSEGRATRAAMAERGKGNTGLSDYSRFQITERLGQKYLTNTKSQRAAIRNYELMPPALALIKSKNGVRDGAYTAAEQAIVNGFNKILDPDSVVREGEYGRTFEGQPLWSKFKDYERRLREGGSISPQALEQMALLSKTYADQAAAYNAERRGITERLAGKYGIDPVDIFGDDPATTPSAVPGTAPPAAPGGAAKPAPVVPPGMKLQENPRTGERRVVPR